MNCGSSTVDWTIFEIENITSQNTPRIPDELDTVKITYWLSISHLIANGLMTLFCISMLLATQFYWLVHSRRWSYWIFFAPVSIVIFISVLIDLTSGWFYSHDVNRAAVSQDKHFYKFLNINDNVFVYSSQLMEQ